MLLVSLWAVDPVMSWYGVTFPGKDVHLHTKTHWTPHLTNTLHTCTCSWYGFTFPREVAANLSYPALSKAITSLSQARVMWEIQQSQEGLTPHISLNGYMLHELSNWRILCLSKETKNQLEKVAWRWTQTSSHEPGHLTNIKLKIKLGISLKTEKVACGGPTCSNNSHFPLYFFLTVRSQRYIYSLLHVVQSSLHFRCTTFPLVAHSQLHLRFCM